MLTNEQKRIIRERASYARGALTSYIECLLRGELEPSVKLRDQLFDQLEAARRLVLRAKAEKKEEATCKP